MLLLAQVSDLHLDGGPRAHARAERVFSFLRGLERAPDAVLLTGDIADTGAAAEYEEARQLLASTTRVLSCPGNHDDREQYRRVLRGLEPGAGAVNEAHDVLGTRILMCDSSVPGRAEGLLGDETLHWLRARLVESPGVPCIVAFHHPPVALHSPFIDAICLQNPAPLRDLLTEFPDVVAVLCGHAHTAAVSTFADRPLVVGPGVVSTLRLPWETDVDLDLELPPAIAFHVLDDAGRLTTHFRSIPA